MQVNLKMQLEAFNRGILLRSDFVKNEYNFFKWSCTYEALKNKAVKLFTHTKRLVKKFNMDAEKYYVIFLNRDVIWKTNDELIIVNIETDCIECILIPKCAYSQKTMFWIAGKTIETNGLRDLYKMDIPLAA